MLWLFYRVIHIPNLINCNPCAGIHPVVRLADCRSSNLVIQDGRRKRCIAVNISVDVRNDKGWWECSRPRSSEPALLWMVVQWMFLWSADITEKHVDVIGFFLLKLW
jgi:hypothetical protein